MKDEASAERIINSIIQLRRKSLDLRIMHENGEWEKNKEEIEKQHDQMSKLLQEADRFLARTETGKWDSQDVMWLEQFLVK